MKKTLSLLLALCLLMTSALPVFADEAKTEEKMEGVEQVRSGLPELRITLKDGLTLNTINSGSKDKKYSGNTVVLVDANGNSSQYENVEIKGRGNYTWNVERMVKKPYQIKFDSKTKVFGMDKAKKWVLLANYSDGTLMRNKLAFDLAREIGMPYTPDCVWADVYVNDEYIGNYLISEKNEVGSSRVPLEDDYGVLCEIDGNYGTSEDVYFKTPIKGTVVALSDSVADDVGEKNSVSEAAFASFCDKLSVFEAKLLDANTEWEEIAELIDVESFIKYYFIQELTEDPDGCRSSFYIWTDGEDDVLHLGPVWDYDSAMGAYVSESLGGNTAVDYSINIVNYMGASSVSWFNRLFRYYEFDLMAVETYNSEIKPVFDSIPQMISGYLSDGEEESAFAKSVQMNFERWTDILGKTSVFNGGHNYSASYEGEVQYLSNWLSQRVSYLDARYASAPAIYSGHKLRLVRGQASTCITAGYKDYYECTDPGCGKLFADENAKNEITDLEAWKQGDGKSPLSTSHIDADKNHKCDNCGHQLGLITGKTIEQIAKDLCPVTVITYITNSIKGLFKSIFK